MTVRDFPSFKLKVKSWLVTNVPIMYVIRDYFMRELYFIICSSLKFTKAIVKATLKQYYWTCNEM